jgi:hypothetical protein
MPADTPARTHHQETVAKWSKRWTKAFPGAAATHDEKLQWLWNVEQQHRDTDFDPSCPEPAHVLRDVLLDCCTPQVCYPASSCGCASTLTTSAARSPPDPHPHFS